MRKFILISAIAAILSATGLASHADIYKFKDKNGVLHFTNIPGGEGHSKIITEKKVSRRGSSKGSRADYDRIITSKSRKYNIEPAIIRAVITAESNWDARAVSQSGAIGLMQLMPSTADDMLINNPFDPEENIEGGTKYLRHLLNRFDEDLSLALAAYNAGPSRVEKSGGIPPIAETRKYVKKVTAIYKGNAQTRIYKVTYDDGTVLYTNTPPSGKHLKLSKF